MAWRSVTLFFLFFVLWSNVLTTYGVVFLCFFYIAFKHFCTILSYNPECADAGAHSDTVLYLQLVWLCTTVDIQKLDNTWKGGIIHRWCHRRDYFQEWWPCWHWSSLHETRWKKLTGDAYLMLEQIIWFQCLTDRNPAATLFLLHSSHILTWSQSINQSQASCLFLFLENVQANVKG